MEGDLKQAPVQESSPWSVGSRGPPGPPCRDTLSTSNLPTLTGTQGTGATLRDCKSQGSTKLIAALALLVDKLKSHGQ